MAAAKRYSGRLAYDPETNFHLAEDGRQVVTPDGGETWVYAKSGDPSHLDRYHVRHVGVDTTANKLGELQLEHGRVKAEELLREQQPHHFEVQPGDPHFEEGAADPTTGTITHSRPKADPDHVAAVVTSHTDAWKEQA